MADNRQFTDHNEIGGVNVYLEDKKLAESPEQNTVASTDYVLLKDTDGVPHKISKANMMSVVKDAIGELLKSNDLGTSVTNVPALNASAFGSATVANLASVLGADGYMSGFIKIIDYSTLSDANDAVSGTITAIPNSSGITHLPSASADGRTILLTLGWTYIRIIQVAIIDGSDKLFTRSLTNTDWSNWS